MVLRAVLTIGPWKVGIANIIGFDTVFYSSVGCSKELRLLANS